MVGRDREVLGHGQVSTAPDRLPRPRQAPPRADVRICKQCYAYFAITLQKCPFCGWETPVSPRPPPTELSRIALELKNKLDERRRFYDQQVQRARSRGFKPGFAAAKFKEQYGDWPPWDWSQATKAAFAQDAFWQSQLDYHQKEKAHWAEVDAQTKAREAAALSAEPEPAIEPEYDHAFSDLLR